MPAFKILTMKYILIILLCLLTAAGFSQTTGYFRYDTIRMQKGGGNSELYIENATRGVTGGVLTNVGGGRTSFVTPAMVGAGWLLTGNASTTAGTNFIGTMDGVGLMFKTNSLQSGYLDVANNNTSFGILSANSNSSGTFNSAFGQNALRDNVSGSRNIALGAFAGYTPTNLSDRVYINSMDRSATLGGDTTESIIYGAQDATAANQRLYANSRFFTPYITNNTSQNRVMGMISGTGEQGFLTLGTGVSIDAGVLNVAGSGVNIYNGDGTLTGDRVVTNAGFDLSVTGTGFVGIGTSSPLYPLSVKGRTSALGDYGFVQTNSSDQIVAQFDNNGRLDLFGNATNGGVIALYDAFSTSGSTLAGHYAFGGKNAAGNFNTSGALYNFITDHTTAAMSSQIQIGYMDAANTTSGYTQPNKFIEIGSAGFTIPGINVLNTNTSSSGNATIASVNNSSEYIGMFAYGSAAGGATLQGNGVIENTADNMIFSHFPATGIIDFKTTNSRVSRLTISNAGAVTVSGLAGTGNGVMLASSAGVLTRDASLTYNTSTTSLDQTGSTFAQYNQIVGTVSNVMGSSTTIGFVGTLSNHAFGVYTNSLERITVGASGSIGIGGTALASAKLDVQSTTQGFLPPRMTATQGSAISSPAEGLIIYVTDTNGTFTTKGWWGWNGAAWQQF